MTRSRTIVHGRSEERGMPGYARLYLGVTFLGAVALTIRSLSLPAIVPSQATIFLVMLLLSIVAQLHKAVASTGQPAQRTTVSYSTFLVFYFASLILMPLTLFVALVIVTHLLEWIIERLRNSANLVAWYVQPFNMAMHIVAGVAAYTTYITIAATEPYVITGVLGALAGALIYLFLNHLMLAGALNLVRGIPFHQSGLLTLDTTLPDFIHLSLGYVVAVLWGLNPWYILPALSPLLLVHRALDIPQLKQAAQIDGKTGLLNAHHFAVAFEAELHRARRFNRPLAVLMADLDLLRNINNRYGHLAGDEVLQGIGEIIGRMTRRYDVAGRFGGEEFCIVLPETERLDARLFAERLRRTIAESHFQVSTAAEPIPVTMSIGVACFPDDALSASKLIHQADLAVYQAKAKGRNRVQCISDVPSDVLPQGFAPEDRIPPRYHEPYFSPPRPLEAPAGDNGEPPSARPEADEPAPSPERPAKARTLLLPTYLLLLVLSMLALVATLPRLGEIDWPAILLLALLAMLAEIFKIDLYGDSDLSIAVAFSFTAALIAGLPGVAVVGGVMALSYHLRVNERWYWLPVHWSAQVLAGTAPLLVLYLVGSSLDAERLPRLLFPMLLAALGHYLITTLVAAMAVALSIRSSLLTTWRSHYGRLPLHYLALCALGLFLALSYDMQGILGVFAFTIPLFMLRYAQSQRLEQAADGMRELRRLNQELVLASQEAKAANLTIGQINEELLLVLSRTINARDPVTGGSALQVAGYAAQIARELGLPEERVQLVRQAAFLHDIGKIGVPEALLNKPERLTAEEYETIKRHALLGGQFLESLHNLKHLAPIVRHHHERWDGHGYPYRLAGENIPIEARILSLCDSVEAMTADCPYQPAMPLDHVVRELERCAESQFDPRVVTAFIRVLEKREGLHSRHRTPGDPPPYEDHPQLDFCSSTP